MTILEAHCQRCGNHAAYRIGESIASRCPSCNTVRAVAMRRLSWFERVLGWFGARA